MTPAETGSTTKGSISNCTPAGQTRQRAAATPQRHERAFRSGHVRGAVTRDAPHSRHGPTVLGWVACPAVSRRVRHVAARGRRERGDPTSTPSLVVTSASHPLWDPPDL